ncbi:MAG: hypothetical protein NZ578_17995 [Candidatus Binatia bacterium]|nr:hypothetical protein [Candidatus Binatia bacterium]
MHVEVSCKKCGRRQRIDIGTPTAETEAEHIRLVTERLSHQPSFECFGGHFEFSAPLPHFWEIHWETLATDRSA